MFTDILTETFIKDNITSKLNDKYKDTPFAGYTFLSTINKGMFGENYTVEYLYKLGHDIQPRINSGHDRLVDNFKTEIKFTISDYDIPFVCSLNHVSIYKDWDRLIFTVINHTNELNRMVWFTKESFITILKTTNIFHYQQGGKALGNDDYMISNRHKILRLLDHSLVRDITDW